MKRRQREEGTRGNRSLPPPLQCNSVVTVGLLLYIVFFQRAAYYHSQIDANHRSPSVMDAASSSALAGCRQRETAATENMPGKPHPVPWRPFSARILRTGYPIFLTSLPKSGTTSVYKYFQCGNVLASHNWIQKKGAKKSTLTGQCIEENVGAGRPPFEDCGEVDVYTDTGYLNYGHETGERCFFPSVDGLDAIYDSYPTATFVNVIRNETAWYSSLRNWSHSSLFVRFRLCNATGFPNGQSTQQDFYHFYLQHNERIRRFVRDRPSLTYVEVQLESPDAGRVLEEAFGISAHCWMKCKPDQVLCEGQEEEK